MLIKRWKITTINPDIIAASDVVSWEIVASSMIIAWRKFCHQHFGALKPDPADYDIHLESYDTLENHHA